MKRYGIVLILILSLMGCSANKVCCPQKQIPQAQEKSSLRTKGGKKVGVVPFAGPGRLGYLAYEAFIAELMSFANLAMEHRQQLERESRMEGFEGDYLDKGQIKEIGRVYDVAVLCFGKVESDIQDDFLGSYVSIRAVDVRNGNVIFQWQQKGDRWFDQGVEGSVEAAAKKAAHVFKKKFLR